MKNCPPLYWWAAEPWLVTHLNWSQLLFYFNIHWLWSSESIKVAVLSSYVEKTFIFSTHSAVTCSKDCPWDTHVTCIESQTDTQMHITSSDTLQTASLSKINDAWHCGPEKRPDWTEARWRHFSPKFPEPNKWCPWETAMQTFVARGPHVSQNVLQTTTPKADKVYHPDINLQIDN